MKTGLLLIGVDNLFRENLKQRMKLEGYRVYLASNKTESKQIIQRKKVDLILLSLVELKREGLEILAAIKEKKPRIEVIIINVPESMDLSIEGMKLGAFDDFFLPLDMGVLLLRIKEAAAKTKRGAKTKKPLMQRYEEMVIAISLAEAGSPDLAHDYLNRDKKAKK